MSCSFYNTLPSQLINLLLLQYKAAEMEYHNSIRICLLVVVFTDQVQHFKLPKMELLDHSYIVNIQFEFRIEHKFGSMGNISRGNFLDCKNTYATPSSYFILFCVE